MYLSGKVRKIKSSLPLFFCITLSVGLLFPSNSYSDFSQFPMGDPRVEVGKKDSLEEAVNGQKVLYFE